MEIRVYKYKADDITKLGMRKTSQIDSSYRCQVKLRLTETSAGIFDSNTNSNISISRRGKYAAATIKSIVTQWRFVLCFFQKCSLLICWQPCMYNDFYLSTMAADHWGGLQDVLGRFDQIDISRSSANLL